MNRYMHNFLYVAFTGSGHHRADFLLQRLTRNVDRGRIAIWRTIRWPSVRRGTWRRCKASASSLPEADAGRARSEAKTREGCASIPVGAAKALRRLRFAIHKVIPDHVAHVHVSILDASHMLHGYLNIQLGLGSQFAAVAAGQGYGAAAD